jgi:hypothetical protein
VARLPGWPAAELDAGADPGRDDGPDAGGDAPPVQAAATTRPPAQRVATATHRLMIGSLDEVA